MKQYTVLTHDGYRVAVTEGGRGIPLVFLHGFSVSAAAYTEMLELLADNGFHVYAFDAPDHGGSDPLPWGHTVKDMAEVIAQAMMEIPSLEGARAVAVGHSMGGWIAAELAAMPRRSSWSVDDLILLDGAVGTEFHKGIKLDGVGTLKRLAQLAAGGARDIAGDARKAGSLRTLWERLRLADILRGSVSGAACMRAAHAMVNGDSEDALRSLAGRVRTTVAHGIEDGIVPWQAGVSAAVAACGEVVLLPGRYHSWMIADPELALSVIRDALDLTPPEEGAA